MKPLLMLFATEVIICIVCTVLVGMFADLTPMQGIGVGIVWIFGGRVMWFFGDVIADATRKNNDRNRT